MRADHEWVSIPNLVQLSAERFPELEALVDGDVRLTFPQLAAAVREATAAVATLGLDAGDRAAQIKARAAMVTVLNKRNYLRNLVRDVNEALGD